MVKKISVILMFVLRQEGKKVISRFWEQEDNFLPFVVFMIKHRGKRRQHEENCYINLNNCSTKNINWPDLYTALNF